MDKLTKLARARADVAHYRSLVINSERQMLGSASIDRLVECGGIIAFAERRALAETLATVDFAEDVQNFLDALDDERDTPGECKDSTRQLDALILAVVAKTLSEIK